MEEVRFYFDRGKSLGLSLLPAGLLAAGVFMILNPQLLPNKTPGDVALIGFIWICVALFFGLRTSFGLLSKKPAIILAPEGITDGTVWNGQGFVSWSNIVSCERKDNDFVTIGLVQDTSPYPDGVWKALLRKASEPEQIRVPVGMIKVTAEDFENLLRAYMTAAQPPR